MKKAMIGAVVLGLAMGAWAETLYDWTSSGSYSVGKSKSVTMPGAGEVYWKLSGVKAGTSYTFVANGSGADVEVVFTYSEDGDMWEGQLASGMADIKTEDQVRCIVSYDDWTSSYIVIEDPDDKELKVSPKGYFLHVSGDEGETIMVTSSTGAIEEPIPVGDMENPKSLTPGTLPSTYSAKLLDDGSYYFTVTAKAGVKYLLSTAGGSADDSLTLTFDGGTAVYTEQDVSESGATDGNAASLVTVSDAGTISFCVSGASGASFGLVSQTATEGTLGRVTVTTKGTDGTWSLKNGKDKYKSGETVAILGTQTIVFTRVTGFSTPANQTVTPTDEQSDIEIVGVYNDTFDPKDDTVAGATKISPTSKAVKAARTLFAEDAQDYFAFTAKDGVYYNFELVDFSGDATISIFKKGDAEMMSLVTPSAQISKFAPGKGDFIVCVAHENAEAPVDAQYALQYSSANVGAISFAKTAVSVKKSVGSVALTVNRSSGEGKVRVLYGTVNDTAKPGVDYVAQQGELVWENGDRKAKTITVKLIPEAFAEEVISRQFSVQLTAVEEDDLEDDEYPVSFAAGKSEAVVTVTETKARAATAVKAATTKTENTPIEVGTYQGVVMEDGNALTNGFPALASVTFTAKSAAKNALSAKVTVAGKTYSFTANTWDADETDDAIAVATLTQVQKSGKIAYTNELRVSVWRGMTTNETDWVTAEADVELTMNIPDTKGTGVQEDITYSGSLFRDNSKIQDYLYAVTNAVGYYTVALVPFGVTGEDGVPAGNGYLTLTLDTKGKAKIAGKLADGTTSISYSSIVAVRDDGDTLLVPVFVARSPYCFGGVLKLMRVADGTYVIDSLESLFWNNDNAALTYDGEEGWRLEIEPVGGLFNTVDNLQAHYLTCDFSVSADVENIPAEALASGYSFVTDVTPDENAVSLSGNAFSTEKKALTKSGKVYDLAKSVNPCNVQVKLTRATGLVSGTFSIWTENDETGAQKEISNIKHTGVMLLSRDETASLDEDILSAGYFTQKVTISETNENGRTTKRSYTASLPFNIRAVDQGEPDWYADDWGDRPETEEETGSDDAL